MSSRLDNILAEQERRAKVAAYLARKKQERGEIIAGIIGWLGVLAWLAGTAIIALALTFIAPHFAYWQAFIIVFAVFISGKRVVGWFKRNEVR